MPLQTLCCKFPTDGDKDEELAPNGQNLPHKNPKNIKKSIKKQKNTQKIKKHIQTVQSIPIFSANGAGVINKIQSLVDNVNYLGAGIVTLQETHFKRKGKLIGKLCEFELFESIRRKTKGGTLIGVHKSLEPILIEEYSEDFELLVVEVKMGNISVRIMSGYGPQENWKVDEKMPFFRAMEEEIIKAKMNGKAIFIQIDANSKLGPQYIEGDPHQQTENGKILSGIIDRNALIVVNGVKNKCSGAITRRRITNKVKEESIIDFVIVCDQMIDMITGLQIDEEKKFVLTKYTKTKNGVKIQESDHNSLITNVKSVWNKTEAVKRKELYNLKDKKCLKRFKEMTTKGKFLSAVFSDKNKNISVQTKQFIKRLRYCISKCFKKIRICKPKINSRLTELFNKRRILKDKKDENSVYILKQVERSLAEMCAEDNMKIINKACQKLPCDSGGMNAGKLWKLKKKLTGISSGPPTAMMDSHGNLVTSSIAIEKLTIDMYKERLTTNKISDGLQLYQVQRETLCDQRLVKAQSNKTPEWTLSDLNIVLKQLKSNISRDPLGLCNELFKCGNSGNDLKLAVLKLMNGIKNQQLFPEILGYCNITSLYKNKGSKQNFNNYRGIFRVTVFRNILDRLIYNDEYPNIDENMTDSNVGARKKRNIRDNIFVINAILNNIRRTNLKGIDIQIFDVQKCFDKLWLKECLNDMYEYGLKNDKLPLLYKENMNAMIAVKNSTGTTNRWSISDVVMQGTVWGSLMCTGSMDKLGKHAYSMKENLYSYKGVPIPPLGMVDDIITVSNVEKTALINECVNTFIDHKKLKFSENKCCRIHIGKEHGNCPPLRVHEFDMKESKSEKYLGDIIDHNGNIHATIVSRKGKGIGIVANILSIVHEIPLGKYRTEMALKLREAMLINGILYNSESWHGVTKKHISILESVDEALLRGILKAHTKTPKPFLYLETGTIPIKWIIAMRRINYLKHIVGRNDVELLKKVFIAQKENPNKGDFIQLVSKDLTNVGLTYDEVTSHKLSSQEVKFKVKTSAKNAAFSQLYDDLRKHTKVKHITYKKLELQSYLKSNILSYREMGILTSFRSKCTKNIRMNFKKMYQNCLDCPLKCSNLNFTYDSQEHILMCPKLNVYNSSIKIDYIYGGLVDQEKAAQHISKLMTKRSMLIEQMK